MAYEHCDQKEKEMDNAREWRMMSNACGVRRGRKFHAIYVCLELNALNL